MTEHDKLHFAMGNGSKDIEVFNVFDSMEETISGNKFNFYIIGSSHYIVSEDYGFYEVASCHDLSTVSYTFLFENNTQHTFSVTINDVVFDIIIEKRDINEFDFSPLDNYSLYYVFEERAVTAIDVHESSYETYHTYPERDLLIYTQTRIRD